MVQGFKFSNEPDRYHVERVARIVAVHAAIEGLQLPVWRVRKLNGLLTALEMQVEDGGDSPEVNRLLVEALRAGLRHQVEEDRSQDVLRAIEAFDQAEATRWEQVRAGTLSPIELSPEAALNALVQHGYALIRNSDSSAACDRWLEAWELAKQLTEPEWQTTKDFDEAYPELIEYLLNWCQDLDRELGYAAVEAPAYHEHRLRFAGEFLERFPAEDAAAQVDLMVGQGRALAGLGRYPEADVVYETAVTRFPDESWGYVGWANLYLSEEGALTDYERAENILTRSLERPALRDRVAVLENLEALYRAWGKWQEAAAIAAELRGPVAPAWSAPRGVYAPAPAPSTPAVSSRKLSRNAPCWCGSGKKYKRCHLDADQKEER